MERRLPRHCDSPANNIAHDLAQQTPDHTPKQRADEGPDPWPDTGAKCRAHGIPDREPHGIPNREPHELTDGPAVTAAVTGSVNKPHQ